uniref:Uncharacterized protein n=1 Tax=Dulem virus 39 TaxID=3145757 RepID=A0AAU8B614_9CAUD
MTLHEFLQVCSQEDYIGLWNVDVSATKPNKSRKRFEEQPTEQSYFKIGNIPYGRICNYLDMDILAINHTTKGYLVRLHNQDKLRKELDNYYLANKIAKAIKREGG